MTEAVQVAREEKVRLEKVSGTLDLDWIALTDAERAAVGSPGLFAEARAPARGRRALPPHAHLDAVGDRARPHPRRRLPQRRGRRARHAARRRHPGQLARACDLVHAIARGEERSSRALIDKLYDETPAGVTFRYPVLAPLPDVSRGCAPARHLMYGVP